MMTHRTGSFTITIEPSPLYDDVWGAQITDSEGPQGHGSGNKMALAGNSLEMIGRNLDEYIAYRKMHAWEQVPRKPKRRRNR